MKKTTTQSEVRHFTFCRPSIPTTEFEVHLGQIRAWGRPMSYKQFCPIAKATEILGERWTILIVREILMGASRFTEIQRGLGDISPALLTNRLKALEANNMVIKRKIPGQRGFEYFPTEATENLLPVLVSLGEWGLTWARHTLWEGDFDVEFLMRYLERSVDPEKIPGKETVVLFKFKDLAEVQEQSDFWLLVEGNDVQLCLKDPGRDISVYFNCTVRTMHDVWMGDRTYKEAIAAGDLIVEGEPGLTRNIRSWLRPSLFEETQRAPIPDPLPTAIA